MKVGIAVLPLRLLRVPRARRLRGGRHLRICRDDDEAAQLLRLNNADEVEANLPLNGLKLAASLLADFQRGAALDVGMLMIGKMMTTRTEVRRDQLRGQCRDATHFLRGATLGAFVMQTETNADIRSAASLFGSSAAAASSSGRSVRSQDGTLDACTGATPDASRAPAQCGALLRGQLSPIGPASTEPEDSDASGCPVGLRRVAGKCTAGEQDGPHDCDFSDAADCELQCGRGSATSCGRAGWVYMHGWKVTRDEKRGADWLTRACDGGSAEGCSALGAAYLAGAGVIRDAPRARDLFVRACDGASARGCQNLGTASYDGIGTPKDRPQALAFWRRACNAGNAAGCYGVGLCLESRRLRSDS